jgi:hypothetical protein
MQSYTYTIGNDAVLVIGCIAAALTLACLKLRAIDDHRIASSCRICAACVRNAYTHAVLPLSTPSMRESKKIDT